MIVIVCIQRLAIHSISYRYCVQEEKSPTDTHEESKSI
jgi:hypothetical protein